MTKQTSIPVLGTCEVFYDLLEMSPKLFEIFFQNGLLYCLNIFSKLTLNRNNLWMTSKRIHVSNAESYPKAFWKEVYCVLWGEKEVQAYHRLTTWFISQLSLKKKKRHQAQDAVFPSSLCLLISLQKKSRWPGCHKVPRRELVGVQFIGTEMTECQFTS